MIHCPRRDSQGPEWSRQRICHPERGQALGGTVKRRRLAVGGKHVDVSIAQAAPGQLVGYGAVLCTTTSSLPASLRPTACIAILSFFAAQLGENGESDGHTQLRDWSRRDETS